jgi:hypothetical protein
MTLPASGPISFNAINVELGQAGTTQANINQASYRTLAGVPGSGTTIALSNFYGKSNIFSFNIASTQSDVNLRTLAIAAGWNGTTAVQATINGGVILSGSNTSSPGLVVDGSWPGGVTLINNGYINGMGGSGGAQDSAGGATGGVALAVSVALTLNNASGVIAGGGGGGGAGAFTPDRYVPTNGGGGGGGQTGSTNSAGGLNAGAGTFSGPGAGGVYSPSGATTGNYGAAGGAWGTAGGSASGGGGASGAAVSGNGNITWVSYGTYYGALT